MYKIFYSCLTIFWILDIINVPFMQIFDTKYHINTLAWILIWIFIPSTERIVKYKSEKEE